MTKATTAQRSTVVAVFNSRAEAERAVADLKRAGFKDDEISLVGKDDRAGAHGEGNKAGTGAATGAAVGAGAAALTSLGITFGVIPVIGPVLALGPIAAALLSAAGGAAAGGLIGALIGLGVPEHEAKYYEGELKSGRYLVTVKAGNRYDEAWALLHRLGAYNYETVAARTAAGGQTMKVHEEQLHPRKEQVEAGEVRLRKEVTTEHKTMDVPVQREEVVVERRPASGQASPGDIRPGEEVRIPVREEQVRVEKTPVVKEEVTAGKRKVQETEQVGGTVRKEEVRVEKQGDVDVHTKGTAKDADVRRDKGR
jgi:uncharacterized protein (TIGR02271 family)